MFFSSLSMELDCMVSIVEELEGKLAELDARLEAIKAEALVLECQKAAFVTVIKVFDPSAISELLSSPRGRTDLPLAAVSPTFSEAVTRRGVLELLRDAEEPVFAGDLSKQFAEREGFGSEIDGIGGRTLLVGFLACSNEWSRQGWFAGQVLPMVVVECGRSPGNPRVKRDRPLRLTVIE